MTQKNTTAGAFLITGILYGTAAWLAYSLVEFLLVVIGPLLLNRNTVFTSLGWRVSAILIAAFLAIGIVFGAVAALAVRPMAMRAAKRGDPASGALLPGAVSLTLVLSFGLSLLSERPLTLIGGIALAISALLAAALVLLLVSPPWRARLSFLGNAWIISALLLGPTLAAGELVKGRPLAIEILAPLAAIVILIGVVLCGRRFFGFFYTERGRAAQHAALAAALVPLSALSVALLHRPLKASLSGSANIAQAATGRPNVLLVTLDTVQAGHLSLYGYHRETSPHLRQLARSATVYKNAIAASDMTLPSHASIFTGLYGREHGAHNLPLPDKTQPLDASFITLAEVLAGKGYVTAAVAANRFYLLPEFGMAQGFRLFDSKMPVMLFNNNRRYILREGVRRVLNLFLSTYDFDTRTLTAAEINQEVLPLLEQLKRETAPFFLFVNYMDAHLPYIPPPPFDTLFPGKIRLLDFDAVTNVELDVIKQKRGIIPQERAHLESQYDGAIAYLDSEFANIIARLQQLGLYDNTMVVVVGDHGESFGDRGMMEHTVSVYQDQVHVPLIIHYPRQTQAETVDTTVSHVDLMPTILDVLGYPMPKPTQGRSLR